MQKALEQINVKLTEAVSDITGKTGLSIIQAILAGERDADQAARSVRDRRCQQDAEQIARALQGTRREEHLFELRQAWSSVGSSTTDKSASATSRSRRTSRRCRIQTPASRRRSRCGRRKRKANGPRFDARREVYRVTKVDLTAIEGIEETTALKMLLGEIGTDMSKWPSSKQFCSWLGSVPPGQAVGGQGRLSSKVRAGPNRGVRAGVTAGGEHVAVRARAALGSFFRRIAQRAVGEGQGGDGHGAANWARLVYASLKHGQAYVAKGLQEYEQQHHERQLRSLKRKAQDLGYELTERQAAEPKEAKE